MRQTPAHDDFQPRVCVCVMMNHPFPRNIPLIRRMYRGRFSKVVFVMPFERSDDPDVFTVYRGAHTHAGFITDVRDQLLAIDCDYFIVVHDDVLLNPAISERTFLEHFPLAPDDGFIPMVEQPGEHFGYHPWYPGVLVKLLFPKSELFGAGVDAMDIVKYMPPIELVRAKLDAAGVRYRDRVKLDQEDFGRLIFEGCRVLLHGHAIDVAQFPTAEANNEACTQVLRQLVDAMALGMCAEPTAGRLDRGMADEGADVVLPFPLTYSGAFSDFYILPRSRLREYAHYIGVWCSTGALVEYAVPTLLHVVCDKVWTGDQLGQEFSFFAPKSAISYFEDRKFIAIHPYKLSQFRDRASQDNFLAALDNLTRGEPWPQLAQADATYKLDELIGDYLALGWYGYEGWGRWSLRERASIMFRTSPDYPIAAISLVLRAPLEDFAGSVGLKGREPQRITSGPDGGNVEVRIPADGFEPDGVNEIEIVSDRTLRPSDLSGSTGDSRTLGFGLIRMTFE